MKLSNFSLLETKGKNVLDWVYVAEVDVTTGALWWKDTERKRIMRKYAAFWIFVDSGKFTPGDEAERLARAWEAQTGQAC